MTERVFILLVLVLLLPGCKEEEPTDPSQSKLLMQLAVYNTAVPEPSGLFYNTKTNSLFTVSDANSTVYEIDLTGVVISSFSIKSNDLEGITFSANNDTIYVVEEENRLVSKYLINGTKLYSFAVVNNEVNSNGPEGIAINTNNNHLYIINEKNPCLLIEYSNKTEVNRREIKHSLDCSDVCYDKILDCLWMVSDESKSLIKMNTSGDLLMSYNLPYEKMEGVSIVHDKIYMVNDSTGELFVFKKP